jgi:hypothetical protein
MGTDWIKMRTDLYRDPKVCVMADHLAEPDGQLAAHVNQRCQCDMTVTRNVMRNVVVGALVTVWGVMRHRGKRYGDDLVMRGVTLAVLDDISDLPGFGEAMHAVGWVQQDENGIVFPRFFEELNHDPGSDARQKNAERQRRYREKCNALRNVTVAQRSDVEKSREEKSREEKEEPPIPPADAGGGSGDEQKKPKKKAASKDKTNLHPLFDRFWAAYPRRTARADAEKAFAKLDPDESLLERMLAALAWQTPSEEWTKDNRKFVPYPASWLNAARWEDEPPKPAIAPGERGFTPPAFFDNERFEAS